MPQRPQYPAPDGYRWAVRSGDPYAHLLKGSQRTTMCCHVGGRWSGDHPDDARCPKAQAVLDRLATA